MRNLKFGWHMHSFPVDGSDGAQFVAQIHATLRRVHTQFDAVWVDDHLMPWATWQSPDTPYLECLTTIAFFAAAYPNLTFVPGVLCQSYRNPGMLAKMLSNLQLITGGRLVFGIGAGWMEPEYRAYSYDFPRPAVRIAQLEETVQLVRRLFTEAPASFDGAYYRVDNAYCEPRPSVIPPLLIGGGGEQLTLRVVATYADWWNISGGTLENLAHKFDVLRQHCAAVGRDFASIVKTWSPDAIAVAETTADARRIAAASPYARNNAIVGTPAEVAEQLRAFADLGVEHFAVRVVDFPSTAGIELFAGEVIPLLRGAR